MNRRKEPTYFSRGTWMGAGNIGGKKKFGLDRKREERMQGEDFHYRRTWPKAWDTPEKGTGKKNSKR